MLHNIEKILLLKRFKCRADVASLLRALDGPALHVRSYSRATIWKRHAYLFSWSFGSHGIDTASSLKGE